MNACLLALVSSSAEEDINRVLSLEIDSTRITDLAHTTLFSLACGTMSNVIPSLLAMRFFELFILALLNMVVIIAVRITKQKLRLNLFVSTRA